MNTFRLAYISAINKEWWILLSLAVISALLSSFGALNQMLLLLYVLPTLFSAYFFGRRHATLTACASVFLVLCGIFIRGLAEPQNHVSAQSGDWWQIMVWGGLLLIFGYATGSLFREMHEMYRGFLLLLRYFLTRDSASYDHLRRIAFTSSAIAEQLKLPRERMENTRAAALLFDLRSFDLNPDLLRKLARLSITAHSEGNFPAKDDCVALERLCAVLPLIINAKRKAGEEIPLESRIVEVAEEFDSLTHDLDMRTALPPQVARNMILRGSKTKFDPEVVDAFLNAYEKGKIVFPRPAGIEV